MKKHSDRVVSQPDLWKDDRIQFARLLSELVAGLDAHTLKRLIRDAATSMDLLVDEVNELFDRAEHVWECAKLDAKRGLR